jgi:glycosyltransferase involved in cell wall biosynthesis
MQVAFLDVCIEMVKALKKHVNLHVLIELTPQGKNLTILEIKDFPKGKSLVTPKELLTEKSYAYLQNYFEGAASVHFVIHPHKTGFSYSTLQVSFDAWKYVKQFRPDIMHFETISLRAIGMLFFLRAFKKVCISIHDPVAHSGEETWKMSLPRKFFFNAPVKRHYLFYSRFAKKQFEDYYTSIREPKMVLRLSPYSFLQHLVKEEREEKKYILFFGRLSPYKGVDNLLKAMPAVFKEFPNERLIIAGKRYHGFVIDEQMVNAYSNNITVIDRHIPNEELADLIQGAKFIVCPYKDATQSGVLMTAFGLKTPVIATNVGSFPEFIEDDVNGLLVPSDSPEKLAERICYALRNDHYKALAENISNNDVDAMWSRNADLLLHTYAS